MSNDKHVCYTEDGVPISVGMHVIDYDNKLGVVVERPSQHELDYDDVCHSGPGHNGHWWGVCPIRDGHQHEFTGPNRCRGKIFDGSRLTTRGVDERFAERIAAIKSRYFTVRVSKDAHAMTGQVVYYAVPVEHQAELKEWLESHKAIAE